MLNIPPVRPVRLSKYELTAAVLPPEGTVLDIGARDRILLRYLKSPHLTYLSADLCGAHDFHVDMEQPLPFPDGKFDAVVALDVLEHLEHIHLAFDECMRVAARLFVLSLPNVSCFRDRLIYFARGRFETGKYDLLPDQYPPAELLARALAQGRRLRLLRPLKRGVSGY